MPPPILIFFCLLLFGTGELAGALLGAFSLPIQDFAAKKAKARPEVHGLVGIEDIDRTIIAKVSSETVSRLHTFHLHGHGVGLLTFILFMVIFNAGFSQRRIRILTILTLAGMLYPFGWLTLMLMIPFLGIEAAFRLTEKLFFMPFGSALLISIWMIILFYGINLMTSLKKGSSNDI